MSSLDLLIVEDEEGLAELYSDWLSDEHTVSTATSGTQALEALDETIDGVLLDRRLPDMSGDEVLQEINARNPDAFVAMVTAVEPDVDIVQLGFDDYMTKPVASEDLHQAVERLAEHATYDEQVREHLSNVAKLNVIESGASRETIVNSEEYDELKQRIDASRAELDVLLPGDVLVELLLRETGSRLWTVFQYDVESWEYRYVGETVEALISRLDSGLQSFVDQLRQEGQHHERLNANIELDGYRCSVHYFEAILFMHFYQAENRGVVCGFDPAAAPNLTNFISLIRPYFRQADLFDGE